MTTPSTDALHGRHRAVVTTSADAPPGAVVTTLADVVPQPVSWLWPGWLPAGKIAILTGDPSTGKSTLALDLAARVSTGAAWPDGAPGAEPSDVLLLTAEDGIADTVAPRLAAAGGDPNRVHVLQAITTATELGPVERLPMLDADIAVMADVIQQHRCRLVIVDVLMAYLSAGADAHRDQDIRRVLTPLAKMAEVTGVSVLLLRHMNKAANGPAMYRGGGSIGISGAARSEFLVARHPEDATGNRRVIASVKSNLAAAPRPLAFTVVENPQYRCGHILWEEAPLAPSMTAEVLLQRPMDDAEHAERQAMGAWFTNYLADNGGDALTKDLRKACESAGFAWNTARKHLPKVAKPMNTGFDTTKQFGWILKP